MNILLGRAILLGGLLASLFSCPGALAQSYPSRTVTIVVTSAAGALTDVLTRAVSQRLSQMWGQSIVVENRGGAGHNFAATAVKAAAADGYTLLSSETGFALASAINSPTDFAGTDGCTRRPIGMPAYPATGTKSVSKS